MIGVGVIGLGFMGRTHLAAYAAAAAEGLPCRVVAVCDPKPARLTGEVEASGNLPFATERLFDPRQVRGTTRAEELLADPEVQLVSICTPTDSHVRLASAALRAGKHVLVEKPVALDAGAVRELARVAAAADRLCMPAMCMRFWPGWDWLREQVKNGMFGRVRSATFTRLAPPPAWSREFYADPGRSGGMLFDLHIHDTDFVLWCFGAPSSVVTTGSELHATTSYRFANGPDHVTAEGAWDLAPSAGFRMRYLVACEHATLDYDLAREPRLLVHRARRSEAIPLTKALGYDGQVRHVLAAITAEARALRATLDDAARVLEVLAAERDSLRWSRNGTRCTSSS